MPCVNCETKYSYILDTSLGPLGISSEFESFLSIAPCEMTTSGYTGNVIYNETKCRFLCIETYKKKIEIKVVESSCLLHKLLDYTPCILIIPVLFQLYLFFLFIYLFIYFNRTSCTFLHLGIMCQTLWPVC